MGRQKKKKIEVKVKAKMDMLMSENSKPDEIVALLWGKFLEGFAENFKGSKKLTLVFVKHLEVQLKPE